MACFSLAAIENLLIWIVVVIALVSIVKLLVPWLASFAPGGGLPPVVTGILNIVFWAIICIVIIMIVFWLLSCLLGGPGGFHFPR